jgi:hypothetical protein
LPTTLAPLLNRAAAALVSVLVFSRFEAKIVSEIRVLPGILKRRET